MLVRLVINSLYIDNSINISIYKVMDIDKITWDIIDIYFRDNPNYLTKTSVRFF